MSNNKISHLEIDGTTYDIHSIYATNDKNGNQIDTTYATVDNLNTLSDKINTKQDKLSFDTTPLAKSNNPVSSNGIYVALSDKASLSKANSFYNFNTFLNQATFSNGLYSNDKVIIDPKEADESLRINENSDNESIVYIGTPLTSKTDIDTNTWVIYRNANNYLDITKGNKSNALTNGLRLTGDGSALLKGNPIVTEDNGGTQYKIIVDKAINDSDGNKIVDTYAKKTDLPLIPVKGIKIAGQTNNISPDTNNIVTIPAIPTKVSSFTNDSGYLTNSSLANYQTKLTFDSTPTASSNNPVTSSGVKTYVDNINNTLNTAISKKANSTDIVQSDWNITDTNNKGFIKNKPNALISIANDNNFRVKSFNKSDNGGRATYRIVQELTNYNPQTTPKDYGTYGFSGILFKKTRNGNDSYLFPSIMNVSLGYSLNGLFSTSEDEYPAVIHNTTTNKYYLAIRCTGSYCSVSLMGFFTYPDVALGDEILENTNGTLSTGWEKTYDTPRFMEMRKIYAGKALMDHLGRIISTTYATSTDISNSVTTKNLTVTGPTSVPTASVGNSTNTIANTAFVQTAIANLVGSAPKSLNTLQELSTALGNDSNFATTVTNNIATKVSKTGDIMTGGLTAPFFSTGTADTSYFQSSKFRGQGDASTYYHAIDFGYAGHNHVDFYEYGGIYNFYKSTSATQGGTLLGTINTNGWDGLVKGKDIKDYPTTVSLTNGTVKPKYSAQADIANSVDYSNIQNKPIYYFDGHNVNVKIGSFTATQTGSYLKIGIYTGNGFNASLSQNRQCTIHFRTSNGSPADSKTLYACYIEYGLNGDSGLSFYIRQVDSTHFELYKGKSNYPGSSFMTVENSNTVQFTYNNTTIDSIPTDAVLIDNIYRKAYTSDIPTKLSQLTNDTGYITSSSSISGISIYKDVTVDISKIASSTTYSRYPWAYDISWSNISSDYYIDCLLDNNSSLYDYAIESGTNKITIYFTYKPTSNLNMRLLAIKSSS